MIDFILSDPKFTVSLVLAILGIILTSIFYSHSKNIKLPCYEYSSTALVGPEIAENNPIKVTFLDEPVKTLTLTYIAFWNGGRATISRDDVVVQDPLRIVTNKGCDILAADIVYQNRPVNNFEISLQRQHNSVRVTFDFLDYRNGLVVRVYHTGEANQDVSIVGSIKGASNIVNVQKVDRSLRYAMDKLDKKLKTRLSRLMPNWWRDLVYEAEIRQSLPLLFLLFVPMGIALMPFIFLYMAVMTLMATAFIPVSLLNSWRYTMPKELYAVMRYH